MSNEIRVQLQDTNLVSIKEMLSSTPSCLKIIDKNGKLLTMNPQGLDLIGADDLKSVLGANIYDLVEESHRDNFIQFNKKICEGAKASLIFEIVALNGERRWMESYSGPYKLDNGEIAHISITNDVSNRINTEAVLLQQKIAIEESSRLAALGQFASGIAHEINNPITIILGRVFMLKAALAEKKTIDIEICHSSLLNIEETALRIKKIINGLRSFSRDSKEDPKKNSNIGLIVRDTLELCSEKFRLSEVSISVDIHGELFAVCNDVQISQVLMNLFNNSYDAISNLKEKWIKIDVKSVEGMIQITFTDSGLGIQEQIAKSMFSPFFTTKEAGHGTGLGLSICVGILQKHDGTFIYNKPHPNTQFVLKFPEALTK